MGTRETRHLVTELRNVWTASAPTPRQRKQGKRSDGAMRCQLAAGSRQPAEEANKNFYSVFTYLRAPTEEAPTKEKEDRHSEPFLGTPYREL